jgi:SAM-dependent methyltransferase
VPEAPLPPLTLNGWLRYDVVARALAGLGDVRTVLEVGAGQGAVGARLAARYRYLGVEPDRSSFERARPRVESRGGRILASDLSALQEGGFDVVCAFEVLEHLEDDLAAVAEWRERLRPGGWLLLSVPAWQRRFGAADHKAGHYRRYDREPLRALLANAGLDEIALWTYGFPLGYVLQPSWNRLAAREAGGGSMAERSAASGRWLQPSERLGWVTRAVSAPFRLAQRPFAQTDLGTGFVARARRPPPGP